MKGGQRAYDVAGTGSMVVDRIYRAPRILGRDEKIELRAEGGRPLVYERVGGVTLNHLGWARILGLRVAVFGKQASDPDGRMLRAGMDRLGIAREIDLSGSASSFAQIVVDDAGERAIYMSRGATGEFTPDDVDTRFAKLIEASSMVTSEVSQVPLATVRRVFECARAAGVRTVLDLDLPRAEAVPGLGTDVELEAVLELTDVLKPSAAALAGWAVAGDPEETAASLRKRFGCALVALTLGKEGAAIAVEEGTFRVPSVAVEVRDSTGAGDAFLGGLVAGLHFGLDPAGATQLANACGAACCERIGAFPDEPEACRQAVLAHLAALGGASVELPPLELAETAPHDPATRHFLACAPAELERVARAVDPSLLGRVAERVIESERTGGRVHVTGVGKPAHVASYVAALLSSTGTPATVLDATEATHGSVGQLRPGDVLIAISNSGTTRELLDTVRAATGLGAVIVAVTADPQSPLAGAAECVLQAKVESEGGPLGLAPRASILAELLVLQALSVELQARRDLDLAEYHRRHPAGALGRKSG